MPDDKSSDSDKHWLEAILGSSLAKVPGEPTGALSEMVSRSLVTLRTNKELGMLHRIGEHELYGPDYRLVCSWAEELKLSPEEVLARLLSSTLWIDSEPDNSFESEWKTTIEGGRFKALHIDGQSLPISRFAPASGLILEGVRLKQFAHGIDLDFSFLPCLTKLDCELINVDEPDLSQVPKLTTLHYFSDQLSKLNLSPVRNLTELWCGNLLTDLDLSLVPNLNELFCFDNQLTELDLSPVSNLTDLACDGNKIAKLDLSQVPNLETLHCQNNRLAELDIRFLTNLMSLNYDTGKTRLIRSPDQNF